LDSGMKWRGVGDKLNGEGEARLLKEGGQLPYSEGVNTLSPALPAKNGRRFSFFLLLEEENFVTNKAKKAQDIESGRGCIIKLS